MKRFRDLDAKKVVKFDFVGYGSSNGYKAKPMTTDVVKMTQSDFEKSSANKHEL